MKATVQYPLVTYVSTMTLFIDCSDFDYVIGENAGLCTIPHENMPVAEASAR